MENASKALIMVVSILIGVMIIAFMVYMFSDASKINIRHEIRENEKIISAFNAKFQTYESFIQGIVNNSYGILCNANPTERQYARFNASKNLNLVFDVVTAVNEAYDINFKNSNRYQFDDYIEYENGMIIDIDFKTANRFENFSDSGEKSKNKYVIFPNKDIESGYVYGMNILEYTVLMNKINNHEKNIDISSYQKVPLTKFLEVFRESRLATSSDNPPDNLKYTLYKYYFAGSIHINEKTQKIDKVVFKLIEDVNY